jgi:hypothetical protein
MIAIGITRFGFLVSSPSVADATNSRLRLSSLVVSLPLLFYERGYGDVGPMDDWGGGLRWKVEDDPLHILQLQERIPVVRLYGFNPENGIHS